MSSFKRVLEHSQQYGVEALSTAELFTLVLYGNGTANPKQREKALQAIQSLLAERSNTAAIVGTDVYELFAARFDEKLAYRLVALLELNRRLARPAEQRYQICCPADAARLVMPEMSYLKTEQMRILALDTKNQVVLNRVLYQGTANSAVLRIAEVYRPAVVRNCPAIILCHNHPSGDPTPSAEDIATTEQVVQAGKLFDIELVDHLVIGNGKYASLREKLHW
jgi:DNA repair protein RadC